MGGLGSGRWYRWDTKDTVESRQSLDIRDWQRRAWLDAGMSFWWGGISVQVQPGWVRLSYRLRRGSEEGKDISETVRLTWTPCHYGNQRPWFLCPGWGCGRRVARLYLGGGYFLCRSCLDLVYESQREDRATRLISKAQKIRGRLGGSASLMDPFPTKPKGMHWRSYSQLYLKARRDEDAGTQAMLAQLERMCARSGISTCQSQGRYGGNRF